MKRQTGMQTHADLTDLKRICQRLAERLQPGDSILLHGPLASGKTQFVILLAEALETRDPVTSPTFGLANFYETGSVPILHIDTYRLNSQAEFHQLGLDEYFDSHIVLVEWGDKVRSDFEDPLEITFELSGEKSSDGSSLQRSITFESTDPRWQSIVEHALQANQVEG